jgi:hypothetical protein
MSEGNMCDIPFDGNTQKTCLMANAFDLDNFSRNNESWSCSKPWSPTFFFWNLPQQKHADLICTFVEDLCFSARSFASVSLTCLDPHMTFGTSSSSTNNRALVDKRPSCSELQGCVACTVTWGPCYCSDVIVLKFLPVILSLNWCF